MSKRVWTCCAWRAIGNIWNREKPAMSLLKDETLLIRSDQDIVIVRQTVRAWAVNQSFGLVDQTKIVTAASELARNALTHGGGGTVRLEAFNDGSRKGLR